MKKLTAVLLLFYLPVFLFSQIKSPAQFLGYPAGEQFTPYYKVLDYLQYLSSVSKNITLQQYGKTYEGRPLFLACVASDENINRLDEIRINNLRLTGTEPGNASTEQPAVVWLSYNVHGNEAVSTEAALQTLYYILNPANADAGKWLKNTIIIIDPCLNPDGRERYINFYTSVKNVVPDPLPFTREHDEPWPGGRFNHYYFDLNRDWAWQSQVETKQRMDVYNKWLPQVHVDFHEQSFNDPYYFAPAAEPLHQDISSWQRNFQTVVAKNNARYFDQKGWLYFTRERFDLLYPSYGDTYPMYNGAIGMTYEQGGSGRAGLTVINRENDTLTLASRIDHHFTAALSTIETASANAGKLVQEYKRYFVNSREKPSGAFKTYIVKGDNPEKLKPLAEFLNQNGIRYGYGLNGNAKGFSYRTGKDQHFNVSEADMIISAFQPKSVLLKVLFEPETTVSDSLTYDITAWALPYAFGLNTYALKQELKAPAKNSAKVSSIVPAKAAIAYTANWNSLADVKFLTALLNQNIRVRYSEVPFELAGKKLNAGTLIITKSGNEKQGRDFDDMLTQIATESGVVLQPVYSGMSDKGPDLGSSKIKYLKKPRIAVISGEESDPSAFGEIWHFFEQQISFPVSVINSHTLGKVNLSEFNLLIIPDGTYGKLPFDKLVSWVNDGGKLIAMRNAISCLSGKKGFSIQLRGDNKNAGNEALPELVPYADRERTSLKTTIPGAIFKVSLDNTHPLAFGFPDYYFTLKLDDRSYEYLSDGWNIGVLKKNSYVAGFVGSEVKNKLDSGLLFGVQDSGEGCMVYLADDPLFRSFWENGKLLFSNAVFMVGD